MKNLKLILPALAIVLSLGIVFTTSAFSSADQKIQTLKYRFIGTSESDLTNPTKWQNVSEESNPESCEVGTELPCLVQFNDNEYSDIADYYSTHDTAAEMFSSLKVVSRKD